MLHRVVLILLLAIPTLQVTASSAWPHGGGLDRYGCHHNPVHGGYHCGPRSDRGLNETKSRVGPSSRPCNPKLGCGSKAIGFEGTSGRCCHLPA